MIATVGPLRFNTYALAEHFREWVQEQGGGDARDMDDWEVQSYFDEYATREERADARRLYEGHSPYSPERAGQEASDDAMRDAGRGHLVRDR